MAQRRLAAIMFTDIVGYDSLLKEDEKKAFDTRKKNHRIHRRLLKKYNGRWLKDMESGTLASFNSNIDAVMCAVSILKAAAELEIPLRIGIHLGDVIFEKKDVLGDGINIASRIHSLIDTPGIVISDTVYKDIKNKEGLEIESLGIQTLKGVDTPIGIYEVICQDESVLDFTIDTGELIRPLIFRRSTIVIGILVIAILAFAIYYFIPKSTPSSENKKTVLVFPREIYLGTDTLDYLIAGMHDAIIGEMGKIGALNVLSRKSAVAYKNEGKSLSQLALEHNIDYIIDPAVLCYSDSICFQNKIFDDQENQLSVQDFSVEKSQILNLFRVITKDISEKLNVALTPEQEKFLAETRSVDDEALDLYMRGRFYLEQLSDSVSLKKAALYFKQAIEKDPTWALSYTGMAEVGLYQRQFRFIPQSIVNPIIIENIGRALKLDPDNAPAHYTNAITASAIEWNWEKGERELKKAIELNPNNATAHVFYAHLLVGHRKTEEALYHAKRGVELDPMNPLLLGMSAMVLNIVGEYQKALVQCEKALSIAPNQSFAYGPLADSYLATEDRLKWYEIKRNKGWWWMDDSVIAASVDKAFAKEGYIGAIKERIRQNEEVYSKGGQIVFCALADRYIVVGNYEKAIDYFEKAYETHDPCIVYIGLKGRYDKLKNNPRYIAILKKMNLPVD